MTRDNDQPQPARPLAELESGVPFAARHIGPDSPAVRRMLEVVLGADPSAGLRRPGRAGRPAVPPAIRMDGPLAPRRRAATEPEVLAELRALAARNTVLPSMIGLGYYGTHHAAGHPAQRAGEPGLVHRLHAVPAGDQPGPARGAAQLPDRGRPT